MWPLLLAMHLWALLLMSRITLLIMVGLRFATCHRILVPKSQVESIFQCFGLIFILMDPLGALLNTLGANLLKSVFLETPCRKQEMLAHLKIALWWHALMHTMFILVVEGKGTVVWGWQAWRGVGEGGGDAVGVGDRVGGQDCWTASLFHPCIVMLLPLHPTLDYHNALTS